MQTYHKSEEYSGHRDCIYALEKSENTNIFYTGSMDGMLVRWDIRNPGNGELLMTVPAPIYSILEIDRNQIAAGASDGKLYLADLQKGEPKVIDAHIGGIFSLLKWNENKVLSTGGDGQIKIWIMPEFQLKNTLQLSLKSIRCVITTGQYLYFGASDNCIYKVRQEENFGKELMRWEAHGNSVFSLCYDQENSLLISGGRDAKIKLWDEKGKILKEVDAHWFHVNDLKINPTRRILASASLDKSVRIWEIPQMNLLKSISVPKPGSHLNSVNKLLWLNEDVLVSVGDDKKVIVHSFEFEDK